MYACIEIVKVIWSHALIFMISKDKQNRRIEWDGISNRNC